MPKQHIASFGPQQFVQGLSPLQKQQNTTGGFFAQATAIDVYRYPGFICPGPKPVSMGSPTGRIFGFGGTDSTGTFSYGNGDKLYQINLTTKSLTASGTWPHTITGNNDVIQYNIGATSYLFYFTDTDIGRFDNTSTFVDNWGSTIPAGAGALNNGLGSYHRAVVFNRILYFTNGSYVASLDGTTGANGTLNLTQLALPSTYTAYDIRVINNRLEIICNSGLSRGASKLVTWDGVSTLPEDITDLEDAYTTSQILSEGFPSIFTYGKGIGAAIRKKNYWGYQKVQNINGYYSPTNYQVSVYNGVLTFVGHDVAGTQDVIFTYGTPFEAYSYRGNEGTGATFPDALFNTFVPSKTLINGMTTITDGTSPLLVVSSNTGSSYALEYFDISDYSSFNNSKASFKTNFTQLPDDSVIDWIKIYVLPPAADTAFTPVLYTDFNTSPITLDGGDITSSTLDANGNSKTYWGTGKLADNFSIGGSWANNSSTTDSIIITRIDVGYTTK